MASSGLALYGLVTTYLRDAVLTSDGNGDPVFTFTPPLSVAEQATFADLQTMAKFGIPATITLAEFQAIKPDLATGKAFVGIASPTQAQSNAALKASLRVIGALLRF